jgi:energy-converting hydrogenase Eha subunit G
MANTASLENAIFRIKKSYNKFLLGFGTGAGVILCIYFFTFSEIINRFPPIVWRMQALSAIGLVLVLVYIKRIAFWLTTLRYSGSKLEKQLLNQLLLNDMDQPEKLLAERLETTIRQ